MTMYRLSWDMVGLSFLRLYSDADPTFYKNTTQTVPNSRIPDEHWHRVSKETDDPFAQHDTLKRWADADTGFVRNVVLEKAVSEPRWEVVHRDVNRPVEQAVENNPSQGQP